MNHSRACLAATLTVLVALSTESGAQTPTPSPQSPTPGRSTVYAPHGVIATSQPLATTAGLRVMQNGGNAIDAAVVAAAVLNLVEPHMTGIGATCSPCSGRRRKRSWWRSMPAAAPAR